jgi:hypothetical protein
MDKHQNTHHSPVQNEEGFVLVTSLMVMLVLTIIGIATTTNTTLELNIAANDKIYKKTFFQAEGGAILGTEIMEQNLACPVGFDQTGQGKRADGADVNVADLKDTSIRVFEKTELVLWNNQPAHKDPDVTIGNPETADIAYPRDKVDLDITQDEVGYIYVGGVTSMMSGGSLQMAAGYEGKGKAAAQGGVSKLFDIYSQFYGLSNSEAIILLGWRHVIGTEGDCEY